MASLWKTSCSPTQSAGSQIEALGCERKGALSLEWSGSNHPNRHPDYPESGSSYLEGG